MQKRRRRWSGVPTKPYPIRPSYYINFETPEQLRSARLSLARLLARFASSSAAASHVDTAFCGLHSVGAWSVMPACRRLEMMLGCGGIVRYR